MALSDPSLDRVLREQLKGDYKVSEPTDNTMAVLLVYLLIPVGLLAGVWFLFRTRPRFVLYRRTDRRLYEERRPALRCRRAADHLRRRGRPGRGQG